MKKSTYAVLHVRLVALDLAVDPALERVDELVQGLVGERHALQAFGRFAGDHCGDAIEQKIAQEELLICRYYASAASDQTTSK